MKVFFNYISVTLVVTAMVRGYARGLIAKMLKRASEGEQLAAIQAQNEEKMKGALASFAGAWTPEIGIQVNLSLNLSLNMGISRELKYLV